MSSHLVYDDQETYVLCFGTSRRTTSLFRGHCLLFVPPRVILFIIFRVIFLMYLALSPVSLPCGDCRVSPSFIFTRFCTSVLFDLFVRSEGLLLGPYITLYVFVTVQDLFNVEDVHPCGSVLGSSPLSLPVLILGILYIF